MKKILSNLTHELNTYNHINYEGVAIAKQKLAEAQDGELTGALEAIQVAERTLKIIQSGAYKNAELLKVLQNTPDALWSTNPGIEIGDEEAEAIAMQFYRSQQEGKSKLGGDHTVLKVAHIGKKIIEKIIAIYRKEGKEIDSVDFEEYFFHTHLLAGTGEQGLAALKGRRGAKFATADKLINIRPNPSAELEKIGDKTTQDQLSDFAATGRKLVSGGDLFYTLTVIPTPEDAAAVGMDYKEYVQLYLEACDQPWEEIGKAHEKLIEKFDKAKTLTIRNQDGTDLTMSIDGMTFANSLVLKNIPGSEIFSAPVRESVNGKIVSKGIFKFKDSPVVMKNLTMTVVNGEIVEGFAEEGNEEFQKIIKTPGANFFGEIGIGTNPHLRQQFLDGLLVEKVGGSFHMAIGDAYKYTDYNGKPVNVNNGNESKVHWDITTMLRGQESEMIVDGETVQRNGQWIDPEISVLNEGWGALSAERQPKRWKERYPKGYAQAA